MKNGPGQKEHNSMAVVTDMLDNKILNFYKEEI